MLVWSQKKIIFMFSSVIVILILVSLSGCEPFVSSFQKKDTRLVGIWDKEGGASFVRDYYQFKRDGTVDFGRLKNDGTRNVLKKGSYKMDGKKVLIQWKHRGPKLKMTEEKLKELEKWHHVLDFDREKNRLYLLSGEEFRRN